jgi:sulfate adenylyltransferase
VFFTGFSGSGKSTIARGLADSLRESGDGPITLLDGDVVRRELSADSASARPTATATSAASAGSPPRSRDIAAWRSPARSRRTPRPRARPDDGRRGRRRVRSGACRDAARGVRAARRKGLYARARAGQLRGMTGVDDPYEEPTDAELVFDTTAMSVRRGRDGARVPRRERVGGTQAQLNLRVTKRRTGRLPLRAKRRKP